MMKICLFAMTFATAAISLARCSLQPVGSEIDTTLLQYGMGQTTKSFLLKTETAVGCQWARLETEDDGIITSNHVSVLQMSETEFNITATLTFEGFAGKADYTIVAETQNADGMSHRYSYSASHEVFGVVLYEEIDGSYVVQSGDDAPAIEISDSASGTDLTRKLQACIYPEGRSLAGANIRVVESSNSKTEVFTDSDIEILEKSVIIPPLRERRDAGRIFVYIEIPSIDVDGEAFETVLTIDISNGAQELPVTARQVSTNNVKANQTLGYEFRISRHAILFLVAGFFTTVVLLVLIVRHFSAIHRTESSDIFPNV